MHCGNPTKGIEHERAEGPFILTTTAVNIYQESVLFSLEMERRSASKRSNPRQ